MCKRLSLVQDKPEGIGYQLWPSGIAMAHLLLDPSVPPPPCHPHALPSRLPTSRLSLLMVTPSPLCKQSELSSMVRGKGVLELGSGCGVVGMAAAMAGASSVVLTDQLQAPSPPTLGHQWGQRRKQPRSACAKEGAGIKPSRVPRAHSRPGRGGGRAQAALLRGNGNALESLVATTATSVD